jgi:hypothetical protein
MAELDLLALIAGHSRDHSLGGAANLLLSYLVIPAFILLAAVALRGLLRERKTNSGRREDRGETDQ